MMSTQGILSGLACLALLMEAPYGMHPATLTTREAVGTGGALGDVTITELHKKCMKLLTAARSRLGKQLNIKKEAHKVTFDQVEALCQQLPQLVHALDPIAERFNAEMSLLKEENIRLNKLNGTLTSETTQTKEEVKKANATLEAQRERIALLDTTNNTQKIQIDELQKQVDELTSFKGKFVKKSALMKNMKIDMKKVVDTYNQKKKIRCELESKVTALEKQVKISEERESFLLGHMKDVILPNLVESEEHYKIYKEAVVLALEPCFRKKTYKNRIVKRFDELILKNQPSLTQTKNNTVETKLTEINNRLEETHPKEQRASASSQLAAANGDAAAKENPVENRRRLKQQNISPLMRRLLESTQQFN